MPTLLHLTIGSLEAKQATLLWSGVLASVMLLAWAAGDVPFSTIGDRIGRTKTQMDRNGAVGCGRGACAFAPGV